MSRRVVDEPRDALVTPLHGRPVVFSIYALIVIVCIALLVTGRLGLELGT